jgi:hypothetical protein
VVAYERVERVGVAVLRGSIARVYREEYCEGITELLRGIVEYCRYCEGIVEYCEGITEYEVGRSMRLGSMRLAEHEVGGCEGTTEIAEYCSGSRASQSQ